ncbi:MAG TPA: choice-of-anchor B family protein [Pyrinomonadaceae bacterium]|jgi:choice-of-anchor B domain-containing protein
MSTRRILLPLALLSALSLAVWTAFAHDGEHHSPGGNGQPGDAALTALTNVPCVNGKAGTFPCDNVDLAAFLPVADIDGTDAAGVTANDIWGWTDPQTDREYALVGLSNGVAFVDVTNPTAPVYLGNLPRPASASDSLWRSVKVYRDHLFAVSEAPESGLQVFDLTQLRGVTTPKTFAETARYNNFSRAHTIAVDEETGFAYVAGSRPAAGRTPGVDTCLDRVADGTGDFDGRGLHIVDIRNPAAPAFAGCVDNDGYTHETECVIYRGPDAPYWGREVCFNANEDTLTIVDVTDKAAPRQLSRTTYAGVGYTHQGWLTGDHARFLLDDELDEQQQSLPKNRTFIWDVSDLDHPFVQAVHQGSTPSIDHNLYVRGPHAFQSNYRSGLRVVDVRNAAAANISEAGFFDIYPVDDLALFNGSWGNYPYFSSGTVIVSGIEQGLFVLRPQVEMPVRIDYAPFYVRQQYRDFLNREPDGPGLGFWTQQIEACTSDEQCQEVRRINVSAAFFLAIEFQNTGYLVERMYKAAYGDGVGVSRITGSPVQIPVPIIRRAEFLADSKAVGNGVVVGQAGWPQLLEANKAAFAQTFVQRQRFADAFPASMTAAQFVDKLFANAGVTPTAAERQAAIDAYGSGGASGRAAALRSVAESATFDAAEKNRAFVLMEYFGYLQRDPDAGHDADHTGYAYWLDKLDQFEGNFVRAEMVKAFISSDEYRQRFGN